MAAIQTLLVIAAMGQTPIDPAELAKAQSALESYYSRIKTVQITYTEKMVPPESREARSSHHDLLYAFPSLRMTTVESVSTNLKTPQEKVIDRKTTTSIHQGQSISIDYHAKAYETRSSVDPLHYPWLPLNPWGLRVPTTLNTPLSDLLKFPDVTSFDGEETIDGHRCIKLIVGPHIPAETRPHYWSDNTVLKLCLAPDQNYLPVRWEILHVSDEKPEWRFQMSLGSFQRVPDLARDATVTFPHRLEVLYSSGATETYHVESAQINCSAAPGDFALRPPSGFTVAKDGMPLTISGGTPAGDNRIRQSVDEAKRLLGSLDPPRDSRRWWTRWPVVAIAVASVVVLLIAGFLKWRERS